MTKQEKDDILRGLAMILEGLVEVPAAPKPERCRMLTVRECVKEARGDSGAADRRGETGQAACPVLCAYQLSGGTGK